MNKNIIYQNIYTFLIYFEINNFKFYIKTKKICFNEISKIEKTSKIIASINMINNYIN